ncbi:MAG: uncharacterized protein KVP18_000223 [Porospora cf. gigantea A]|uniref:uncharacterized protein n=1 Tax=Porospora cf. gigantea A TaxID=2853593 RepID=UPI00355A8BD2|nr:MAG: hypothetical protein KVP18_000223 [Porospora cf. gigantea A]
MRVDLAHPLPHHLTTLIGSVLNTTCDALGTLKNEVLTVLPDIDMLRTSERALLIPTCDVKDVSQHLSSLTLPSQHKPIPPIKELRVEKSTIERLLAGRRLTDSDVEVFRCGSGAKQYVRKTIRIPSVLDACKNNLGAQTVERVRVQASKMTTKAQAELQHTMEEGDSDVLLRNWGPVIVTQSESTVDFNFLQDDGGKCLDEYVHPPRMPLDEVLNVAAQVAKGLKQLRQKGILHRDIKPGNLTMDENGRVRIIDFDLGMSTQFQGLPQPTFRGTYFYSAPETRVRPAEERFTTFASDVWCLGISLVELLCPGTDFQYRYEFVFKDICAALIPHLDRILSRDSALRLTIIFFILNMLRADPRNRSTPDEIIDKVAEIRAALTIPPASSSKGHRSTHIVEDSPVDYAAVKELLCNAPLFSETMSA